MTVKRNERLLQRREEIIEAALVLWESRDFSRITLADIAREARFTRSNIYKYFSTREDLFLEILRRDLKHWAYKAEMILLGRVLSTKEFSHIWVDLFLQNPRFLYLFSQALSHWEKRASVESLTNWMVSLENTMARIVELLKSLFPQSDGEDLKEFLHSQFSLCMGMIPLIYLNENQKSVRERLGMASNRGYYREILSHGVESLLNPWV